MKRCFTNNLFIRQNNTLLDYNQCNQIQYSNTLLLYTYHIYLISTTLTQLQITSNTTQQTNITSPIKQEVVPMLQQQLDKCQADRNWTQLERDTVQTFYDVTRSEVRDLEMSISLKDRAMELMEDNHRVEVRVYVQKVKHLEYEHKNCIKAIDVDSVMLNGEEGGRSDNAIGINMTDKKALKDEILEKNGTNAKEIMVVKIQHEKILQQMREVFVSNLDDLTGRCDNKLTCLEEDLELRRKVSTHYFRRLFLTFWSLGSETNVGHYYNVPLKNSSRLMKIIIMVF